MAKKKKGGKKKRVAAHIKENQGKRAAAAAAGDGDVGADKRAPLLAAPLGVGKPKRPREPDAVPSGGVKDDVARKEKDRTTANNYLAAWLTVRKAKEAAEEAGVAPPSTTGVWKFNKNTQAWLLRHIFSEDQVDEKGFGTLCLYLEGLKGAGRQRVLAAAQEIIDKHGPDEGEEQTAAAREAAREAAEAEAAAASAVEVEAADETVAVVPSGYNSDSTDEGEEDIGADKDNVGAGKGDEGGRAGVVVPPVAVAAGGSGGSKGEFAFSFFDANAAKSTAPPQNSVATTRDDSDSSDSSGSSSDDSSDDDDDEEGMSANSAAESSAPATKKPRKARSALTGQSKAEAKAKVAAVAYERALQVAEMLS
ncbi:unnamed protein product [Scytosiphon promiscuus]